MEKQGVVREDVTPKSIPFETLPPGRYTINGVPQPVEKTAEALDNAHPTREQIDRFREQIDRFTARKQ